MRVPRRQPKTIQAYLLPAVLFLALIGANVYIYRQNTGHSTEPTSLAATSDLKGADARTARLLPLDKVKDLATIEAPDTAITGIELRTTDSKRLVYVVTLGSDTHLTFDAQTGARLSDDSHKKPSSKEALPFGFTPTLDFETAQRTALAQYPGGVVGKIELVPDKGIVVYSVHFTDGAQVAIAAADGAVVSMQPAPDEATQQQPLSGSTTPDTSSTDSSPSGDETPSPPPALPEAEPNGP
jgi:uncharacterized membrane protein YkoI